MAIQLLEQHMAELIAAGEVVERPASVVKELVENAIDAKASMITVEIKQGGILSLRVTDNGSGIEKEEIALAFLRHATSKIRTQADLEGIETLGFRGEALPSIASVAQVELTSATESAECANKYVIHGGNEVEFAEAAHPRGTTILVENLFYNTPARMKFLKKDASEATFVSETVLRLALSNPQIKFCFIKDGKQSFQTPGDGKIESAVYALLGAGFANGLVSVKNIANPPYEATGLVTSPLNGRASRAMQFFYINGRFVKNRTMMAALEQAFRGVQMHGKFPGGVLFLNMPAELVDVNVHPAKTEVRFAHENDVFGAIYKSVKASILSVQNNYGQVEFKAINAKDVPVKPFEDEKTPEVISPSFLRNLDKKDANVDVFKTSSAGFSTEEIESISSLQKNGDILEKDKSDLSLESDSSFVPYKTSIATREYGLDIMEADFVEENVAAEFNELAPENSLEQTPLPEQMAVLKDSNEKLRLVGEVFKTYILAEIGQTLCIIDKHAAHERLIYEELIEARQNPAAQQLLTTIRIETSAKEKNALLANKKTLYDAGIEVDDFGENCVIVRSVPADMSDLDVTELVVDIANKLSVNEKDSVSEKQEWVLHSVACRAAVKAGDRTPNMALLSLAEEILNGKIAPFCPHGRPVVLEISKKELEKQFGRLG